MDPNQQAVTFFFWLSGLFAKLARKIEGKPKPPAHNSEGAFTRVQSHDEHIYRIH